MAIGDYIQDARDFLKDYEFKLDRIDAEKNIHGKIKFQTQRDSDNFPIINEHNIDLYKNLATTEIIQASVDFNLEKLIDDANNKFASTVMNPIATVYYAIVIPQIARSVALTMLQNSRNVDECQSLFDKNKDTDTNAQAILDCYMSKLFEAVFAQGLIKTFPVLLPPDYNVAMPFYNILPSNNPSGFSIVFLSMLIPKSGSNLFTDVNAIVNGEDLTNVNKFINLYPNPDSETKNKLLSIFNNKDTENGHVIYNGVSATGSLGAIILDGEPVWDSANTGKIFDELTVTIDGNDLDTDYTMILDTDCYIESNTISDLVLHDFSGGSITFTEGTIITLTYTNINNNQQSFSHTVGIGGESYTQSAYLTFIKNLCASAAELDFSSVGTTVVASSVDGEAIYIGYEVDGSPTVNVETFGTLNMVGKLEVYDPENESDFTLSSSEIVINNYTNYNGAPYIYDDDNNQFIFISKEIINDYNNITDIDVLGKKIDITSFDITHIQNKAFNGYKNRSPKYDGFGSTYLDYKSNVVKQASDFILSDIFDMYLNYIIENFQIMHIGLSQSTPPVPFVSPPVNIQIA